MQPLALFLRTSRSFLLLLVLSVFIACAPAQSVGSATVGERPRIWLTPELLDAVRQKAEQGTPDWARFQKYIDGKDHYNAKYLARSYALAYQVTGQRRYAQKAIQTLLEELQDRQKPDLNETPPLMMAAGLVYDWCYDELSPVQRQMIINWVNQNYEALEDEYISPWHNYAVSLTWAFGIAGYATQGDNPQAEAMIQNARQTRYAQQIEPGLRQTGDGGDWVESSGYGPNAVLRLVQYAEAVLTVTGEDLFHRVPFYRDRIAFTLFHTYPGALEEYGRYFRQPYIHGDGGRGLKGHQNYLRASLLMLVRRFRDDPMAPYAQDWLNELPANRMPHEWASVDDVMWLDPEAPSSSRLSARMPLSHYAAGAGGVYMRSDWTADATWVSFLCGDHFEYHQHLDQNSFTLWKYEDLAVESGVYNWANSDHANNYYARTIAHNSMLIFDPEERFSWDDMRGGYKGVNDGGQRAWKLDDEMDYVSWSAEDVFYWERNRKVYDTGDIERYEDTREYVYVLGNATNAYRRDKVENFTRQLVFFRPNTLVVFDRVRSTRPQYKKSWLLHFLGEPFGQGEQEPVSQGEYLLTGDTVIYRGERGRLVTQSLWPIRRQIRKIGGTGVKDTWVNGELFDPGRESYGSWRIEISPEVPRQSDLFLHVLTAGDADDSHVPQAERVIGDLLVGARIGDQVVLFAREEVLLKATALTLTADGAVNFLLCDVEPETPYQVSLDGSPQQTALSTAQNTLSFTLQLSGQHTIKIAVP